MSPKIIVGVALPTIIKRLKLIRLFRDRHIVHGQSLDLPPLHRDRRLATARHEVSRGHSAIVLHAWRTSSLYSWTMPVFYVRARSGTSNRAVRSKKTTATRYQNKNRYDVPRGRVRAPAETACRLQIGLARSPARSIATGSRQDPTIRRIKRP